MAGVGSKTELLNVLSEVKARVQDKLGIVDFPMPQFILIGKQSVGKSRLIETLAGETFNFISGTLGSRRPTVLEFRNVASLGTSRWSVRDRNTNQWGEHPTQEVMKIIGAAHEELGTNVSEESVYVRVESPRCVDMQIVDLPGFRDFAMDPEKQSLANRIEQLVLKFMRDSKNVMLCVEQAGDAATMSTLTKCRELDPNFQRTVLIRNKLDKYYNDLTPDNVNNWVKGFGDLPEALMKQAFALTLPFWKDGQDCPRPFELMVDERNQDDVRTMQQKGLDPKFMPLIGFRKFVEFMDRKVEQMFGSAINPVLKELQDMRDNYHKRERDLQDEYQQTDPSKILSTTRDCGSSFASALNEVMEGTVMGTESKAELRVTLEEELRAFHQYHSSLGSDHFMLLPSEDFADLDDYIEYLKNASFMQATFDVGLSGGAQFRRLMMEVEIFLRFSEIAADTKKRDVIQARGVSMTSLTWRDVVVKLLGAEAHLPLQRRVQYVGERITWFFESQKGAIIDFMQSIEGMPAHTYSTLYPKHIKIIAKNEMMRHLIFQAYDRAARRQLASFMELFQNMLTSTFANPWAFLKGSTTPEGIVADLDPDQRIPQEIASRAGIESKLSGWLQDIPTESHLIDVAVDQVQMLVLKIYGLIRSQVCDQVELFAESFFKVPMLRRLQEDMANIDLSESDKANYEARRERITKDIDGTKVSNEEVVQCIDLLQNFKVKCEARSFG